MLYDGDCRLCRVVVAALARWDRRRGALRLVAIQSREGGALLADLTLEQRLESLWVVDEAGHRHAAGRAAAEAVGRLRGGHALGALLARFEGLTEAFYRTIAGHRGALGRLIPAAASRRADAVLSSGGAEGMRRKARSKDGAG
ncbi:MAG: DCC1-like thiol-disulfide oxidoreductase family protein [Solirubrobacteraceae bacterium]